MSVLGLICFMTTLTAVMGSMPRTCSQQLPRSLWSYNVDLMKNLQKSEAGQNILISPLNTYIALSTLLLGAGNRTREDLSKILKIPADGNKELTNSNLHETLARVIASIHREPEYPDFRVSKAELANGLFVQKSFPVKESYTKQLKDYYNGTACNVDYTNGNEATDLLNSWVSQKTHNRIPKFFSEPIERDTLAYLISTLYFNARWEDEFEKSSTQEEKFNTGSAEIMVPMMSNRDFLPYVSSPTLKYDAISIPYIGGKYAMNILLPHRSQTVQNLTDHLHLTSPLSMSEESETTEVQYKIPKMKFDWKKSLEEPLNAQSIFSDPDLSELTPVMAVKISKMLHATEIEVDEEGTVASAVTAVQIAPASAYVSLKEPVQFVVDRPFLFMITHKPTCTDLFTGIVHKPM